MKSVCLVTTYCCTVWINRVRLLILLVISRTGKMTIFPCPCLRLRNWSRETGSAFPSRVSLIISMHMLNLVRTLGIPSDFRGGVRLLKKKLNASKPSDHFPDRGTAIRHRASPDYIRSHNCVTRWRSLPRVRWHRASSPQCSSKRVLPLHYHGPKHRCFQHAHFIPIVGLGETGAAYDPRRPSGLVGNLHTC